MMRIPLFVAGASLAAALGAPQAAAQVPLTPRAVGTGGAYLGLARGHETLFLNPANLGLAGSPRWSIGLAQISAGGTVIGPSFQDVRDILNADDLEQARKDEILASIPASGTELGFDVRAPLVTIQTGGFALGLGYGVMADHTFDRDLVDLVVNGFDQNRYLNGNSGDDYRIRNTTGSRMSYLDFAAGYGRNVGPLSVGATAHYYRGRTVVRSRASEPRVLPAGLDIQVDYTGVLSDGGNGWGVDVGAALQPVPGLTLSAAVANALSSMNWSEELRYRRVTFNREDFNQEDPVHLRREYEDSERPLDASAPADVRALAQGLTDEAEFPATLRLGAAYEVPGVGTAVSAAFHSQVGDGRLGGNWEQLVGIGVQQKLPLVTARVGFSTDLEEGSMLGGGLTLGPLNVAVARLQNGDVSGNGREGWVASFGLSVKTESVRGQRYRTQ